MPLLPYALARPFLFGMDAEAAHDLTLKRLAQTQNTPLQCAWAQARVDDPLQLAGLRFPNRVGLAAGLDKNARCIDAWNAMGFGFVEVGTVTPLAQSGNPKPRMFRLPQARAVINRLGFNNEGLQSFVTNVQKSKFYSNKASADEAQRPKTSQNMVLGLNIGKNATTPIEDAARDYLTCLDGVYPYADYVTVNISSPNTQNLRSLQSDAALDALLHAITERRELLAVRHGRQVPIFLKIAPDLDAEQVALIAATLKRYDSSSNTAPTDEGYSPKINSKSNARWGVIATNTTLSRDAVQGLPHAQEAGGLSGAPVFELSNRVITQLRHALGPDFPIIGVGGILSAHDALTKIQAGANLVQLYSGLIYEGPGLVGKVARGLQRAAPQRT